MNLQEIVMFAVRRFFPLQLSFLLVALAVTACSHDRVATTPGKAPEASTPVEPGNSRPADPVAATPPVEPTPSAPPVSDAKDVLALKPGQSATLAGGTTLHYVRMVNDSRCPPDVQCIWAGEVTIELTLDTGKGKQTFTLKDDRKTASILGYEITLISIDRNHLGNFQLKKM